MAGILIYYSTYYIHNCIQLILVLCEQKAILMNQRETLSDGRWKHHVENSYQ